MSLGFTVWFAFHRLGAHRKPFRAIAAFKATTMGHIQRHHLVEAKVVVPPPRRLGATGDVIDGLCSRTTALALEARTLACVRDLLVPELISGELRVPEAKRAVEAVA